MCVRVPTKIIEQQEILGEPDLSYVEYPIKFLDKKERGTWQKVVKMYKTQWDHHTEEEATWDQGFLGFLDSTQGTSTSTLNFIRISGRDSF